jgi:hypothetical protein
MNLTNAMSMFLASKLLGRAQAQAQARASGQWAACYLVAQK